MAQLRPVMRLVRIAQIIEAVDARCTVAGVPGRPTLQEMKSEELNEIYKLAKGNHMTLNPDKNSKVKYI